MSAPGTLPRVLAGCPPSGALDLAGHQRVHGSVDLRPDPASLIDAVERSGLRGRGGAGFPTATKLRAVAAGRRPVAVVNGAEGEPASAKDRLLLEALPHLVLDGAVLAAGAAGAREVLVCVPHGSTEAIGAVTHAISERRAARMDPVDVRVVPVADRYVSGEESALVNQLNGGPPLPTFVPPRPFERGVGGRPTLISNAETLSHVACIARHGPGWFAQTGTAADPGSALVTLSGAVRAPGVREISLGSPLDRVLASADLAGPPRAVLVGGYFGAWARIEDAATIALGHDAAAGPPLGCGVLAVLPEVACGWCETSRIVDYLADESAGQCGPCVFGLRAIADAAAGLGAGLGDRRTVEQLVRWSDDVEGRGACHHPNGAVRLVRSALTVFADDVARHASGRPCSSHRAWLPLPPRDARRVA